MPNAGSLGCPRHLPALIIISLGCIAITLAYDNLLLKKKKKNTEKKNQSHLWLDRSAVKPSHVENRAAAALQDQKTEWANSIIRQNYLTGLKKKKKDKTNTPTLTPQMSQPNPRDLGFWCRISAYYPLPALQAYFFQTFGSHQTLV